MWQGYKLKSIVKVCWKMEMLFNRTIKDIVWINLLSFFVSTKIWKVYRSKHSILLSQVFLRSKGHAWFSHYSDWHSYSINHKSLLGVNMREKRLIATVLTCINTCINTFHLRPGKPVKNIFVYNATILYVHKPTFPLRTVSFENVFA